MALVPCRECGRQVSTEAPFCAQCGVPDPAADVAAARAPLDVASADARGVRAPQAVPGGAYVHPGSLTGTEREVYRARVHGIVYVYPAVFALIAFLATRYDAGIALGSLAIAALLGVSAYVTVSTTEFAVTTRRVIAKRGWISRHTLETLLDKVEAVSVNQGPLGRLWDYGTIVVTGTGGSRESFPFVASPMRLRKAIHEQIDRVRATAGR